MPNGCDDLARPNDGRINRDDAHLQRDGLLNAGQPLLATRPFRSPHHTISNAGLVGGGSTPAPGEISLSHNGILFLDELPEFNRQTLEVMRQPLEDGIVTISRALSSTTFPARFMLIAALNPCPCGYRNDPRRQCNCSVPQVERYMSKISGPLLDRIDMHSKCQPFRSRSSAAARPARAAQHARSGPAARERQQARFRGNHLAHQRPHELAPTPDACTLDDAGQQLLKESMTELGLSARAHDKVLRVARTIADLDGQDKIQVHHLNEAINYRLLDRKM